MPQVIFIVPPLEHAATFSFVWFNLYFVDAIFGVGDGKYAFRVLDQIKLFFATNNTVSAKLLIARKFLAKIELTLICKSSLWSKKIYV